MKKISVIICLFAAFGIKTSFGQPPKKVLVSTMFELTGSLSEVRNNMEGYAKFMNRNWALINKKDPKDSTKVIEDPMKKVKDSLMKLSSQQYVKVHNAYKAVIDQFVLAIMTPSILNNASVKEQISKKLKSLQEQSDLFTKHYYDGSDKLINGSNMNQSAYSGIVSLIEAGVQLFNEIKRIVVGQRQRKADDFRTSTKMLGWEEVKKE